MDEDKKEALRKLLKGEPVEAAEEVKPKGSIKRTVSSTGFEDYDQQQLLYHLDHATTADVRSRVQIELGKRFAKKYKMTLAHIIDFGDVAAELLGYKQPISAPAAEPAPKTVEPEVPYEPGSDLEEPDYDPAPQYNTFEPEPTQSPPQALPPLSRSVILEIERGERPYGPYLLEIVASGWDYRDHRTIPADTKSPMRKTVTEVIDWLDSHKNDQGIINPLSFHQGGTLLMILNVYLHWKTSPKLVSNIR